MTNNEEKERVRAKIEEISSKYRYPVKKGNETDEQYYHRMNYHQGVLDALYTLEKELYG